MKAIHTASAILAAAAIFLSPVAALALNEPPVSEPVGVGTSTNDADGSAVHNDSEPVATVPDAVTDAVSAVPDAVSPPEAKVPAEVAVPVQAQPEPVAVAPVPDAALILYPSQLPACDDGSGAVFSNGVPVSSCVWNAGGGTFVAVR